MPEPKADFIFERLLALRTELVDRAFILECRGRLDAADEAMTISAQVAEILEEFETARLKMPCGAHELAAGVANGK